MPTNNFKLFDENKSNLITDTEYQNSTQRLNGVQTGVASSQLHNKFAYQVSLVAYAIAQTMNANGLDASDSLSVSAFVGNLQGTLLQKVADRATSVEAAAGVLNNKYITPQTLNAAALLLSGGVMQGALDMAGNRIKNLPIPTDSADAATKGYVDNLQFLTPILICEQYISFSVDSVRSYSADILNNITPSDLLSKKGIMIKTLNINTGYTSNKNTELYIGTGDSKTNATNLFSIQYTGADYVSEKNVVNLMFDFIPQYSKSSLSNDSISIRYTGGQTAKNLFNIVYSKTLEFKLFSTSACTLNFEMYVLF